MREDACRNLVVPKTFISKPDEAHFRVADHVGSGLQNLPLATLARFSISCIGYRMSPCFVTIGLPIASVHSAAAPPSDQAVATTDNFDQC